jgi:predicted short-subunit dehydrogenase-like oxidoreductase (DUF2520 family)
MAADAAPPIPHLWIVGAGRVGLALALLLRREGAAAELTLSGRASSPPDHPLFREPGTPARYLPLPGIPDPRPGAVLIAVPDSAVARVARSLAGAGLKPGTPVLHTSGALGTEALTPLAQGGCSVGSLHPLAAVADPVAGAERLRGAWYALEGEGSARNLGERLVSAAGGRVLAVAGGAKPLYHASAVVASNFVVTLLNVAERIARRAGVPAAEAREALAELAAGAVRDVAARGPEAALTGPVSRGDRSTVELHLARLSGGERALYSVLARETVALARRRGLNPAAAQELEDLLGDDS